MDGLVIYKASAGSGKTYKLTEEFIRLAFKVPFHKILAVTFTNKATAEMKQRVISELSNLASGKPSGYLKVLMNDTSADEIYVRNYAGKIVKDILQNYSRFSIGTIDSFFQKIIRGFAKEAGLHSGFELELNNKGVLSHVTDEVIAGCANDKELILWLMDFAESRIVEGKTWDIKNEITKLGNEIFSETYQKFRIGKTNPAFDRQFLNLYRNDLIKLRNNFRSEMSIIGKTALSVISDFGLSVADFSFGSSGVAGYFEKIVATDKFLPGIRVMNSIDNPELWSSKKNSKRDEVISLTNSHLAGYLNQAIKLFDEKHISYISAEVILSNYYTFGILNDISAKVAEYCSDKHIFLLSDAGIMLEGIINGNDTPFIYEKTGNRYKHFMIDEFQDTSRSQWNNFIPLINESLSENNRNVLVGDVKQSIYRWRNGDWNILAEEVEKLMSHFSFTNLSMDYNYRSDKVIIDFNNFIFKVTPKLVSTRFSENCSDEVLSEKICTLYNSHYQKLPENSPKTEGFVSVRFEDNSDGLWSNRVVIQLPILIEQLLSRGYNKRDVAILVRNNSEGRTVAAELLKWNSQSDITGRVNIDFISEEFLLVNESLSVSLIVSVLKLLTNIDEPFFRASVVNIYCRYLKSNNYDDLVEDDFFCGLSDSDLSFEDLLPEKFFNERSSIVRLPLPELIEQIISIFELNQIKEEVPYLTTFLDAVMKFYRVEGGGVYAFLDWWDDNGDSLAVKSNYNQDAIKIMTIHKAKGLEFKTVIIPFCNWKTGPDSRHDKFLWCTTNQAPFNNLELFPVKFKKELTDTFFADDYYKEMMQTYIDNLNLLYVAFTRAESELYLFSPEPKEKASNESNNNIIGELLFSSLNHISFLEDLTSSGHKVIRNKDNCSFEVGEKFDNVVKEVPLPTQFEIDSFNSVQIGNKPGERSYSQTGTTQSIISSKVEYGKMMHSVFERINTVNEIENSVNIILSEGRITYAESLEMIGSLKEILNSPKLYSWFNGSWSIKNEAGILLTDGHQLRPDRIMEKDGKVIIIDYKFGETETPLHNNQINMYKKVIKEMGYSDVTAYLLYISNSFSFDLKEV